MQSVESRGRKRTWAETFRGCGGLGSAQNLGRRGRVRLQVGPAAGNTGKAKGGKGSLCVGCVVSCGWIRGGGDSVRQFEKLRLGRRVTRNGKVAESRARGQPQPVCEVLGSV